jgi:hypothetical protein
MNETLGGGSASQPIPFDWQHDFDIAPMQDVGTASGIVWDTVNFGYGSQPVSLLNGQTVYYCLAAVNKAGLRTVATSTGLTVDTTPPKMIYVADGVTLPAVTTQSYVDSLFLMYEGADE